MPLKRKVVKKPPVTKLLKLTHDAHTAYLEDKLNQIAVVSYARIPKYQLTHMYGQKRVTAKIKLDILKRWRKFTAKNYPQLRNFDIKLIDSNPLLGSTTEILMLRTDKIVTSSSIDLFELEPDDIYNIYAYLCSQNSDYRRYFTFVEETLEIDYENRVLKCNLIDGNDYEYELSVEQSENYLTIDTDVADKNVFDVKLYGFKITDNELIFVAPDNISREEDLLAKLYIHVEMR